MAKTKSFNRAAEITNTSQPTVSRQVKRLQDVVGSQLFVSTPRGVKLTQKGEALAQALSRLDHTLHSLTSDLKAETREAEGIVRVSITDGLNALFAAPALVRFSAQYPKIQLHLKNPINLINLRENQTDMMIGIRSERVIRYSVSESSDSFTSFPLSRRTISGSTACRPRNNLEQHLFIQSEYYLARTGLWDGWQQAVARGTHRALLRQFLCLRHAGQGGARNWTAWQLYAASSPASCRLEIGVRISVPLFLIALTERLQRPPGPSRIRLARAKSSAATIRGSATNSN